jgi:predicted acetyltransferase
VDVVVRSCSSVEELAAALGAIGHYFGLPESVEGAERFAQWIDVERMHAAFDGDQVVGAAGAFSYRMSVPGGADVGAAGVTVVGVLPTHRRRGILSQLMRAQLSDAHARGEETAYLWASEATIYGRFGYGLASRVGKMTLPRERVAFAHAFEPRGVFRLVSAEEAAVAFPPLHEALMRQRPGMFSRSSAWWLTRRLADDPFGKQPPKNRVLLELDGKPAGYALYTVKQDWVGGSSSGTLTVLEAVAPEPDAARELWRWLLDFDWTSEIVADLLPVDHELFWLLVDPRRMRVELNDGVWVRLVDVGAALSARAYAEGAVVLDVRDGFVPSNEGRWRVSADGVERVDAEPELALDLTALGSAYLGGFSFAELQRGLRVQELRPGAVARADALFVRDLAPWCPEIF